MDSTVRIPNIEKAQAEAKRMGDPPKPGDYVFQAIQHLGPSSDTNGNSIFKICWEVIDGEEKGKTVWSRYTLNSHQSASFLVNNLGVIGVDVQPDGGFDASKILGKCVTGTITLKDGYTNIQRIRAAPADFVAPPLEAQEDESGGIPF